MPTQTTLVNYVDNWPNNPWTGVAMADTSAQGGYHYSVLADFSSFKIEGFGKNDAVIITVGDPTVP